MTYRIRSDETWALARDDYLAGDDAMTVCERYDLGLSALRKRAKAEGWRRQDRPDPQIEASTLDLPTTPVVMVYVAADQALSRTVRLALDGRVNEASRWLRLHRQLERAADWRDQHWSAHLHEASGDEDGASDTAESAHNPLNPPES